MINPFTLAVSAMLGLRVMLFDAADSPALHITLVDQAYFIGRANDNSCLVVYPDGAYHLERRRQEAHHSYNGLTVYESRLSSDDLEALKRDLDVLSHKGLAEYQSPALPMTISTYQLMTVELTTNSITHNFGYLEWTDKDKAGPPNNSPDEVKRSWRNTEVALQPLRRFTEGLLERAASSNVEQSKANLCGEK